MSDALHARGLNVGALDRECVLAVCWLSSDQIVVLTPYTGQVRVRCTNPPKIAASAAVSVSALLFVFLWGFHALGGHLCVVLRVCDNGRRPLPCCIRRASALLACSCW